jgi:transketolase
LIDRNQKSSYGVMKGRNDVEPFAEKWAAFGWNVLECDGHDYLSLSAALENAEAVDGRPSVIICNTIKGRGIPFAENNPTRSNFALTEDQYLEALDHLDALESRIQYELAR